MTSRWTTSALLLLMSSFAVACGGGGGDGAPPPAEDDDGGAGTQMTGLFPPELHTGFDGQAVFKVPAKVYGVSGPVTFSIDDSDVVELEVNGDEVIIISKDTGTAILTAEADGKSWSADIFVALYDPMLAGLGDSLYATSCAECHAAGDGSPDHTPSEIGQFADSVIATMIYAGVDADGTTYDDHQWELEGDDMRAMLRHIRQLEPRGVPAP